MINLVKIQIEYNPFDIGTKILSLNKFKNCLKFLNITWRTLDQVKHASSILILFRWTMNSSERWRLLDLSLMLYYSLGPNSVFDRLVIGLITYGFWALVHLCKIVFLQRRLWLLEYFDLDPSYDVIEVVWSVIFDLRINGPLSLSYLSLCICIECCSKGFLVWFSLSLSTIFQVFIL